MSKTPLSRRSRDVAELYDLSEVLEGLAARRAAERAAAPGNAELGGSPRLTELLDRLHIQTFSFQLRHARGDRLVGMGDSSLSEHLAVARAISGGDPGAAEREMREHLRNARERFLRLPDSDFA